MNDPKASSEKSAPFFGVPSLSSCLLLGYLTGSFAGFVVGFLALQLSKTVKMDSTNQMLGVVMIFGLAGGILGLALGVLHRVLSSQLRHTPPVLIGFGLFTLAGLALALFGGDLEVTKVVLTVAPFSVAGSLFGIGAGRAAEIGAAKSNALDDNEA
ncbi:MAG: hypothetical protein GY822_07945 [Deltaproteobacteria bacterium]|nr:hypothetical protein [Deltaproteobacteria bacterium]